MAELARECVSKLDGNLAHREKEFAAIQCEDETATTKHREPAVKRLIGQGVKVIVFNSPLEKTNEEEGATVVVNGELVPLTSELQCVTISYRHSGPSQTVEITCASGDVQNQQFHVTRNAVEALQCVSQKAGTMAVWLDQISSLPPDTLKNNHSVIWAMCTWLSQRFLRFIGKILKQM
eukprot:m.44149 g.44149  ORF g.44149 m.44149 type:complete len:178 (+) comp10051_c0_seq1:84-617(+)